SRPLPKLPPPKLPPKRHAPHIASLTAKLLLRRRAPHIGRKLPTSPMRECAMIARPPLKFAALKCPEATLLANLVRPKCKSQCVRATKKTLLSKLRTFTRKCQPQCVHSSKGTWRRRTRSTPRALWLPHSRIGKLPSTPLARG